MARASIWCGLLMLVGLAAACTPDGSGGGDGDDCRRAAAACAPGFACVQQSGGTWTCVPGGDGDVIDASDDDAEGRPDRGPIEADAAPPADMNVDVAVFDAAPQDAQPFDAQPFDAATLDAEPVDVGPTVDAEPIDAWWVDGQPEDAEAIDAEVLPPDAGPVGSPPGGPCAIDDDCAEGTCAAEPGGRCLVGCAADEDCGPQATCVADEAMVLSCFERCLDGQCREGWRCVDDGRRQVCQPDCAQAGCPDGLVCGGDGRCRPAACVPQAEQCNGADEDCDGRVDEDAPCGPDEECRAGQCGPPRSNPGGPCLNNGDCLRGVCRAPSIALPGGFCEVRCDAHPDCDPSICALNDGRGTVCGEPCGERMPCREGWVCEPTVGMLSVCLPGCASTGCPGGLVCGPDNYCTAPGTVAIRLEQVFIRPATSDGAAWDGFGQVDPDLVAQVIAALGAEDPLPGLLGAFGAQALANLAKPDPRGTATLTTAAGEFPLNLPVINDTFTPVWRDIIWRGVRLEGGVRLRLDLQDSDLVINDPIGAVVINQPLLEAALRSGVIYVVRTDAQGSGYILAVAISVVPEP